MHGSSPRHILTRGRVQRAFLDAAANIWGADKVNQPLAPFESVLLLVDQETTAAPEYVQTLVELERQCCSVGVFPISNDSSTVACLERLLSEDTLEVEFSKSRFRLRNCEEANLDTAPPILRRARYDDKDSVSEDLETADLLVLQGHAGPVDGGFGRWLTLCSRHLHQPGRSPLYSCFGTERCFRQALHGRTTTSLDGLVDPTTLRSPLLVLAGCGTLPIPGSLFRYETSIARSIMASKVRAAVMTHGVSATPLSVFIVFIAMLARGYTLGEAVREANHHGQDLTSPSSSEGLAAGCWIVLGNPEIKVLGLQLLETLLRSSGGNSEFNLNENDVPAQTGRIVSLAQIPRAEGKFDLVSSDGRWIRGASHRDGRAYVWVSGRETRSESVPSPVVIALPRRPPDPVYDWRRMSLWLQTNRVWLERMATVVAERNGDDGPLRSLITLWDNVSGTIEHLAFASSGEPQTIAPPLAMLAEPLIQRIAQLDRVTALTVASAVPVVGARLFRLWSPTWPSDGYAQITERCSCGCCIIGNVRRHVILGLVRVYLLCPACGPLGDVSASCTANALGAIEVTPAVMGVPKERLVARGATMKSPVQRRCNEPFQGFACAALFDSFRERRVVTETYGIPPLTVVDVPIMIPNDWPEGLSHVAVVVVIGGQISLLDFDIVVHASK